MVKKLFKHEFFAYMRIMLPVWAILLCVAVVDRVIQFFEVDSSIYYIVFGMSVFVFVTAVFVSLLLAEIFAVVRFYRHLFMGEGYLSFTLPVTPTQHILVKLVTAVVFETATLLVSLLATWIVISGDVANAVGKAIGWLFRFSVEQWGVHVPLYIVEFLLMMMISTVSTMLLFYMCITIGQTFRKNRVLAAVGVYFVYYLITQVISTMLSVIFSLLTLTPWFEEFLTNLEEHMLGTLHVMFIGSTVLTLIMGAVYFLVSRHIITKRLNLE